METHIDILQQFMALNREFDTDVPIEVNEAIEELINENFHLTNRVQDLETALIDTDRLMQEYLSKCLDLEQRLSNCIEPKFKVGQEVWSFNRLTNIIFETKINDIDISIDCDGVEITYYDVCGYSYWDDNTFTTKEEARAKLKELKK